MGTTRICNIEIIQRFQSEVLRIIISALWYVTNETLHHDLSVQNVRDEIKYSYKSTGIYKTTLLLLDRL